jgi:hypothetical protein
LPGDHRGASDGQVRAGSAASEKLRPKYEIWTGVGSDPCLSGFGRDHVKRDV